MTSYYSVIQLIGDPVADERLNLGMIVLNDAEQPVHTQFTADFKRAATLLGSDIANSEIEELIVGVQEDLDAIASSKDSLDQITKLGGSWRHAVRITQPRASTLSPDELVEKIGARVLPPRQPRPRSRDRRQAIALARSALRAALRTTQTSVQLKNNVAIPGNRQQSHTIDLGLVNGFVRRGVTGLSLEGDSDLNRNRELGALKWLVDDVKAHKDSFPVSIILLANGTSSSISDVAVLRNLGAEFVGEGEITDWASRVVSDT